MASGDSHDPNSVLFVCLGNICRSTMSEAVFRHQLSQQLPSIQALVSRVDSCGTGAYHAGAAPDPRTMTVLRAHGITQYRHSARKLRTQDFKDFHWLMAMDSDNYEDLLAARKRAASAQGGKEDGLGQVAMWGDERWGGRSKRGFRSRGGPGEEVDDPYYGGSDGFEEVYAQVDRFAKGFLEFLKAGSDKGRDSEL